MSCRATPCRILNYFCATCCMPHAAAAAAALALGSRLKSFRLAGALVIICCFSPKKRVKRNSFREHTGALRGQQQASPVSLVHVHCKKKRNKCASISTV